MDDIKISMCASAIRPHIWQNCLDSLKQNKLKYEVIFAGDVKPEFDLSKYPEFTYIYTKVKPAQAYECCFRKAKGYLLSWFADDATYPPSALDDIYSFWKSINNEKAVMAFRTIEDGRDITDGHRFRGRDRYAPQMAPFGVMSTKFFHELGGYDREFVCGQSENDVVMRVYEAGGEVKISQVPVYVHHEQSHHSSGTVFRSGFYGIDRQVLEEAWVEKNIILTKRKYPVKRFEDEGLIEKTQGNNKGKWE